MDVFYETETSTGVLTTIDSRRTFCCLPAVFELDTDVIGGLESFFSAWIGFDDNFFFFFFFSWDLFISWDADVWMWMCMDDGGGPWAFFRKCSFLACRIWGIEDEGRKMTWHGIDVIPLQSYMVLRADMRDQRLKDITVSRKFGQSALLSEGEDE